jgi:choline-sulfatase
MTRSDFACLVSALLAIIFPDAVAAAGDSAASPPFNVLFIAVDDMRDWVGFMGGYRGTVHTPHMDRLARRGTAFLNAHCAAPVCCPSRAAVMSGRYPSSTGIYNNQQWLKPHLPQLVTLPMYFRQQGYVAAGSGKLFHHTVGSNPPEQWDAYHRNRFTDNAWAYQSERMRRLYPFTPRMETPLGFPFSGLKLYSDEVDWGVLPKPEEEFDDALVVDYAIRFLQREHDRPFFLACGTFRPHLPWYIPQKYLDLYPEASIQLPEAPPDDLDDIPPAGQKLAARKRENLELVQETGKWRRAVSHYLASISFADAQIGRLLAALDSSAASSSTVIVLWSDHGWHLGEKGHWHKRTLWEAATRVPLIIVAPGVSAAGQRCHQPASLIDLYPTLVDLCELPPVEGLDGQSLVPQLRDSATTSLAPALTQSEERHCAIRDQRWRYIRYRDGSEELYDHTVDPNEWQNLAADESLLAVKQRLAGWLPPTWAPGAPDKRAYDFDPHRYTWRVRSTCAAIEGGRCDID